MRHGALFNGIGGFQLAAHWMGWENVFHCEIDHFCNQVVKQHFPNSICYEDIKQTDFTRWRGNIDIVSGGFPCQPYSTAGKRKGDQDDRHLWPEMLRAIGEIQPRWVLGENVPGLVNWGNGVVFQQIQADLEAAGYEVFPPVILPACSVNAPQLRDRVWVVAHIIEVRSQAFFKGHGDALPSCPKASNKFSHFDAIEWVPIRRNRGDLRNGGRLPRWVDRIGALGNAVVPPLVYEIFKAIEAFNNFGLTPLTGESHKK